MQMPPNVRVVRLNCSSRVNPQFVMRAFERGADGVIISGCHPGDCHYSTGNYFTRRRIAIFSELLDFVGVDSRRLTMSWVSASQGGKWRDVVSKAITQVKELGPFHQFSQVEGGAQQ
jgi:coenzyme F420-reducing hydrogenase delta subunit